jgi:curved DNA-binding protein CbpA
LDGDKPEMNFYLFLEIPSSEKSENIKAIIRRLWRENHPDRFPGDKEKAEITRLANGAFEWLMDDRKRGIHDRIFNIASRERTSHLKDEQKESVRPDSGSSNRKYRPKPPRESVIHHSFQGRIHVEITKTRIVQLTFSPRPIRGVISASSGANFYELLNKSVGDTVMLLIDGNYVSGVVIFLEPAFN